LSFSGVSTLRKWGHDKFTAKARFIGLREVITTLYGMRKCEVHKNLTSSRLKEGRMALQKLTPIISRLKF